MRKTALVALVVPLSLLATACGDSKGDDLTDAERAYADALAIGLATGENQFTLSEGDRACMAEAAVLSIGADVFEEHEVEPDALETGDPPGMLLGAGVLTEEQATGIIDDWQDCTDLPAALAASSFPDDEDAAACLAEELDDRRVDVLLVPAFVTEDGAALDAGARDELIGVVTACAAGTDAADAGGAAIDVDGGPDSPPADLESFLIEGLTASFASGGAVEEDTARCLAEGLVASIGAERLYQAAGDGFSFEAADPAVVQEIEAALQASAAECEVPPELLTE